MIPPYMPAMTHALPHCPRCHNNSVIEGPEPFHYWCLACLWEDPRWNRGVPADVVMKRGRLPPDRMEDPGPMARGGGGGRARGGK